ncbi:hypothetical protein [Myroides pelagicus]|uniref:Uncharacterized protein n=1 Tax=Myroides pelagicus TaxID=270914 RepID=A0A7K1GLY8_9FLAO|nr:hypothetical protein [Myroides pelagicus]MEC4113120.1 hypothetical protein [Myroides pelagicus]MTH29831.1 hypothetical protein [Myroides pelagicus]
MQLISVDFQSFIDNYSDSDREFLNVDWNGKYGAKFKDENHLFRLQIAEAVCEQLHQVDLGLIRDLFITLGQVTKLNFSVYRNYHLLAQELLERGGVDYLFDYVCAAHISFDAYLSTANIVLSSSRKQELLVYFDYLRANSTDAEVQKLLSDQMRSRFATED